MMPLLLTAYRSIANPICRRFDRQAVTFACSRAAFSAGSRMAIRSAMIPITTSSSTSVNPRRIP
jgi:hypothetical protein